MEPDLSFPTWAKVEKHWSGFKSFGASLVPFKIRGAKNDFTRVWNMTTFLQQRSKWKTVDRFRTPLGPIWPLSKIKVSKVFKRVLEFALTFSNMDKLGNALIRFQTPLAALKMKSAKRF